MDPHTQTDITHTIQTHPRAHLNTQTTYILSTF